METWMIWSLAGFILILAELIVPGGVCIFIGVSAMIVGGSLYLEWVHTVFECLMLWMLSSIILLVFLRTLFIRKFEGDSSIQNVDEDKDLEGTLGDVIENIYPYKEGRIAVRGSTWKARSDQEIVAGQKAIVIGREGNTIIVKNIEEKI